MMDDNFMFTNSISVAVEAPTENLIQEIGYDGQEIYQQPLTLSEHLGKQAQKIDWIKGVKDTEDLENQLSLLGDKPKKEAEEEADKKSNFQQTVWPWESVHSKLKAALTEICVLHDVVSIAKDKRYMVLDPAQQETPDTPEAVKAKRNLVQLFSKKRALTSAANILLSGAERLRLSHADVSKSASNHDFHLDLLRLRQNWILKKVGNSILGDLSFKSAGSRYTLNSLFEVSKAEENPNATAIEGVPRSAINIEIPTELQGDAFIQVTIQKDQDIVAQSTLNTSLRNSGDSYEGQPWSVKLERAQNVLFCKELFATLAREAVQLQASIPHMVVGNQITASLFPGIQILVSLIHTTSNEKKNQGNATNAPVAKGDHNYILEHSLHQLLCYVHGSNIGQPVPHPSSAPLGPSKRRRMAGPQACYRDELLTMTKSTNILEQIIRQGQHVVLRLRTMFVIDSIAREIRDPLIISHWNVLNSPSLSCVKIIIMTHGYDTLQRTALVVHVGEKSLKCVCRDGRVLQMSYEPQELRDLILCQISQHQINTVQSLARFLGWHVVSSSNHLGIGTVEPLGNASSCVLSSPSGNKVVAVRCGPQSAQPHVYCATFTDKEKQSNDHASIGWDRIEANFEELRLDKIEGRNFLSKLELVLASAI